MNIKQSLTRVLRAYDRFMGTNRWVVRIVGWQHRMMPLPYRAYDILFRTRWSKRLLNFYGGICFNCHYKGRDSNLSYWLSPESLYWHFWRQTDVDTQTLRKVFDIPEVKRCMSDGSLTAVEIGFGIGKNYKSWIKDHARFRKYWAVEANPFVCDYLKIKYARQGVNVINRTIDEFIRDDCAFDVLIAAGGVFMYLDVGSVDDFFARLPQKGVKKIVIINEGTAGEDWKRPDNTTMFNFRSRLERAGYRAKFLTQFQAGNNKILEYFVMV